jgi:hypothetical protein
MDRFRTHFGTLEWGVQSYVDEMQIDSKSASEMDTGKEEVNVQYYRFPEESSYRDQKQQEVIDAMEQSNIKTILYVSKSDGRQIVEIKKVPAKTIATAKSLLQLVGESMDSKTASVAVAFQEDDQEEMKQGGIVMNDFQQEGEFTTSDLETTSESPLLKETQTFSSWFSVPTQQPSQEKSSSTQNMDMDLARLEYTISQLQQNLKDPNCTRDMDEMASELRQAKRELSALKWKRRLGFSR